MKAELLVSMFVITAGFSISNFFWVILPMPGLKVTWEDAGQRAFFSGFMGIVFCGCRPASFLTTPILYDSFQF